LFSVSPGTFTAVVKIITKIWSFFSGSDCRDGQELTCGLQWKVIAVVLNKTGVCHNCQSVIIQYIHSPYSNTYRHCLLSIYWLCLMTFGKVCRKLEVIRESDKDRVCFLQILHVTKFVIWRWSRVVSWEGYCRKRSWPIWRNYELRSRLSG
jgi:hypothetical protein